MSASTPSRASPNTPKPPGAAQQCYNDNKNALNQARNSNAQQPKQLFFDDPEPPDNSATEQEKSDYLQELEEYAQEMLDTFSNLDVRDENLWLDFVNS